MGAMDNEAAEGGETGRMTTGVGRGAEVAVAGVVGAAAALIGAVGAVTAAGVGGSAGAAALIVASCLLFDFLCRPDFADECRSFLSCLL